MSYFSPFIIPFAVGTAFLFTVIAIKWITWTLRLDKADKKLIVRGFFSPATLSAAWEVFMECLLHRRIFKVNPILGYMHMSLAFGWFLLISVGMVEAASAIGSAPLHAHVFFRYFSPEGTPALTPIANLMDALLLMVLSGVLLAWLKRFNKRLMGMRKTTRHIFGDRIALTALWFIFPLRLTAESFQAAEVSNGGFVTQTLGNILAASVREPFLSFLNGTSWWLYSLALGFFFIAMPFSRYMHIFTEIPLIFLRHYRLRSKPVPSSMDNFQLQACSRCGICIDPCQLQSQVGENSVQSVYFIRDRRYGKLTMQVADDCLMCGRCQQRCPVQIDLNTLRLSSRSAERNRPDADRYSYIRAIDRSSGEGRVGYFAGCMTLLTPAVSEAMRRIFSAAGESVWFADSDGGICCGRPLKLSGNVDDARRMMERNTELFRNHGITTLVTSCPICQKVFREDYCLDGIEVLHHTEYILRLIRQGRLTIAPKEGQTYTYHDPCELGRGSGIYDEPREIISLLGTLLEPAHHGKDAFCCGSSLANLSVDDQKQKRMATAVVSEMTATGAGHLVTACPLCKKALSRGTSMPVEDIAQSVAERIMTESTVAESRS